ncbi:hypothetical protein, partial [Kingella kingae]|uniref:hypothetical protein n=1 Tax=Kingella kingae TaxID=504 RepID=UPI001E44237C
MVAANNPASMVAALNRAFEATAIAEAPSATSLGTTSTKPLLEKGKTILLQSVFRDATTVVDGARVKVASGDVLGLEATLKGHKLEYEKKWSAGEKLQAAITMQMVGQIVRCLLVLTPIAVQFVCKVAVMQLR